MTRDEFMQTQWSPYPQPPSQYWEDSDWCFGKIAQKVGVSIQFAGGSHSFDIRSQQSPHPTFGKSISAELLRSGDVVAYQVPTGAAYLLSPHLGAASQVSSCEARVSWQTFLETVRDYFRQQDFRYWQTPNLLASPGIDAHIDFFTAQGVRTQRTYFLPTSPEFALKKAIADGETKVFEIKSCFRDDDNSPTHTSEFTMLEWYRAYADKWELFEDFLDLVRYIGYKMKLDIPIDFSAAQTSVAELFLQNLNFQLNPQTSRQELLDLLASRNLHVGEDDDWDDLFFRLYIEFIEPALGSEGPQAVFNFPASQSSLSRKTDNGWADRFEIYWKGMELANAYQEQTDPREIELRYQSEIEKRLRAGKTPHPQDPQFLEKMREGFPPCAGIALGLDRLWMVLNKIASIQSLR